MSCDSVSKLIPLYYYGELSPEEEDRIEEHIGRLADAFHKAQIEATTINADRADPSGAMSAPLYDAPPLSGASDDLSIGSYR